MKYFVWSHDGNEIRKDHVEKFKEIGKILVTSRTRILVELEGLGLLEFLGYCQKNGLRFEREIIHNPTEQDKK